MSAKASNLLKTASSSGVKGRLAFADASFHFIGAGGIGMSGLAKVLLKHGARVSGSDQTRTPVTHKLCSLGAEIGIGHNAANLEPAPDAVVISAAIAADNAELAAAAKAGCKIYKYAEMLGEIMNCYRPIAVAGTHGKSTTSGWLAYLLHLAGVQPSFIVGADIAQLDASSGVGDGPFFIAEACEYDRSFLNFHPEIGVILNIEPDHLDYYSGIDEIIEAFTDFANNIRPDGLLIAAGDDPNIGKVLDAFSSGRSVQTFGFNRECDYWPADIACIDGLHHFDVYHRRHKLGRTRISVPGRHNIANGLAVIAAAVSAGVEPAQVLGLLPEFTGMDRRLMLKAEINGITVLDDYAHHPTEITASLSAVRQRYNPDRLLCVFQPHQYSRTRFLLDDFARSFELADIIIVPEIYFVRDTQTAKKQINAQVLVDRICTNHCRGVFIDSFEGISEFLKAQTRPGDLVITMGAGDIWKVADEYIRWLAGNSRS